MSGIELTELDDNLERYLGKRKRITVADKLKLSTSICRMDGPEQMIYLKFIIDYARRKNSFSDLKTIYGCKIVDGKTYFPLSKLPNEILCALFCRLTNSKE